MMKVTFPYPDIEPLDIPQGERCQVLTLPSVSPCRSGAEIVAEALRKPVGTPSLRELARGKQRILIVADDISRPTPIADFVSVVLKQLHQAGVQCEQIEFIMALGSHRPMTQEEMAQKLGADTVERYQVHNHDWANPDCLEFMGYSDQGAPVWINTLVKQADCVIGLGAIMPIDVCGFTGGGKILIPGVCGEITNSEMHWTRIDVPSEQILGTPENPIRHSIEDLARKAGLDFIVNVVLNPEGQILHAVAGDMVQAHRAGCDLARQVHGIEIPQEFDVVIADSFPFDIELWQANKAIGTTGDFVKSGGVIILVSPCYEGLSQTHAAEILKYGYRSLEAIKQLVQSGELEHKVVGVHMYQVSSVVVEKATLILVSSGISREDAEQAGLCWAATPQQAFQMALDIVGEHPEIAVLKGAAKMLPLKKNV